MNMARDYAANVDLELAGWRVIRVWECDIKTKAKQEETLERLYNKIVGTEPEPNTYESSPDSMPIAAEPPSSYGNNDEEVYITFPKSETASHILTI